MRPPSTTTPAEPGPAAAKGAPGRRLDDEAAGQAIDPAAATAPRAAVFVGLGANLGDARATLLSAIEALRDLALPDTDWRTDWRTDTRTATSTQTRTETDTPPPTGLATVVASSLWRSAPVDASGPDFLNAVARFETTLSPHALLDALQAVEKRFGRERPYRNAPRTLDLDLLLYGVAGTHGGICCADERLELPHPRAAGRAFVLAPLAELWPDGEIPGAGRVAELLALARRDVAQEIERASD